MGHRCFQCEEIRFLEASHAGGHDGLGVSFQVRAKPGAAVFSCICSITITKVATFRMREIA